MNALVFFPRKTFMHKVDSRVKILMFIFMSAMIFLAQTATEMSFVLAVTIILSRMAKLPKRIYINAIIPMILIMTITTFINILVIKPGPTDDWSIMFTMGQIHVYYYTVFLSLHLILRVYSLVLFSGVLLNTTEQREMASAITWLIYPLKYLKVPIHEIGLIITLGLRFIPTLLLDFKVILRAQASRGLSWYSGGPIKKIKAVNNSFIPLFVNNFTRADDIANSMAARGYEIRQDRTSYYQPSISWRDFVYIGIMSGLFTFLLVMWYIPDLMPAFMDPAFWFGGTNPWW